MTPKKAPENSLKGQFVNDIVNRISNINIGVLALFYVILYICIESLLQNIVQIYIFMVFLALSGIYFSWFVGGRLTMFYVAFFNIFNVFLFSKLLWSQQVVVTKTVFLSKSFILMYLFTLIFIFMVILWKSPADAKTDKQKELIERERLLRQNFEFMVASRKLKQDLLAQANMVKDELQLIEGAWRSNIHDIINDLPMVKEEELYRQIILPFQDNIIRHLRELERKLTFDMASVSLSELYLYLGEKVEERNRLVPSTLIEMKGRNWRDNRAEVAIDTNKIWDMLQNIIRNSQAAGDLKKIEMLTQKNALPFTPTIGVYFNTESDFARISVVDNCGGVSDAYLSALYKDPVLSKKRRFKKPGKGTLFVKFFADRMGIRILVENVVNGGENGLKVTLEIPFEKSDVEKAA